MCTVSLPLSQELNHESDNIHQSLSVPALLPILKQDLRGRQ